MVAILWLHIFLPAISFLLTPLGVQALARAQQAHAKALSNFINLRTRSALAAARARHPELYSRLHNRVYKPGKAYSLDRPKRQVSVGDGSGFDQQPTFSERFNPDFSRLLTLLHREEMENANRAPLNFENIQNRHVPLPMNLSPSNVQPSVVSPDHFRQPLPSAEANNQNEQQIKQFNSDMSPQPHRSSEGNHQNRAHELAKSKGAHQEEAMGMEDTTNHSTTQKAHEISHVNEAKFGKTPQDPTDNSSVKSHSNSTSQVQNSVVDDQEEVIDAKARKNQRQSSAQKNSEMTPEEEDKFNMAIQHVIDNPPGKNQTNTTNLIHDFRDIESISTTTEAPRKNFTMSPELARWMKEKLEEFKFNQAIQHLIDNPPNNGTNAQVSASNGTSLNVSANETVSENATNTDVASNGTSLNVSTNLTVSDNTANTEVHQIDKESGNNTEKVVGSSLDQQKEAMEQLQNMWNMNGFSNNQGNSEIIRDQQTLESPEPHLFHHKPKVHSKSFSYVKDKNHGGTSFAYSSYDKWRQAEDHTGVEGEENKELSATEEKVEDLPDFQKWLEEKKKHEEFNEGIQHLAKNPPQMNQEPKAQKNHLEEKQIDRANNSDARTSELMEKKLYKLYSKKLKLLEKKLKPTHAPYNYPVHANYYDNNGYYRNAEIKEASATSEHEHPEARTFDFDAENKMYKIYESREDPEIMQQLDKELEEENRNFPEHDPNHPGHVDGRCADVDDKLYKLYHKKLALLYKKIDKKSDSVPIITPYYGNDQYNANYYPDEGYNRNSVKDDQKSKAAEEQREHVKDSTEPQVSAAWVGATHIDQDTEDNESMLNNGEKSAREPHFKGGFTHSHTHFFQKNFGDPPLQPNILPQPVQINLNQNSFANAGASATSGSFVNQQQSAAANSFANAQSQQSNFANQNGFNNAGAFQPSGPVWENSGGQAFAQANANAQSNFQSGFLNGQVNQQKGFAHSNAQSGSNNNNFQGGFGGASGASAQSFAQAQANSFNQSPVTFGLGTNSQSFASASANAGAGTGNQWIREATPIQNEELFVDGESLNDAPKFTRNIGNSNDKNIDNEMSFITNIVDQSLSLGGQINNQANSNTDKREKIQGTLNSAPVNDEAEGSAPRKSDLDEKKKSVFDTMNFVTGIVDFGIKENEKNQQRNSGSIRPLSTLLGDSLRLKRQMEMNRMMRQSENSNFQPIHDDNQLMDQLPNKHFFLMQEQTSSRPKLTDEQNMELDQSNNLEPLQQSNTSPMHEEHGSILGESAPVLTELRSEDNSLGEEKIDGVLAKKPALPISTSGNEHTTTMPAPVGTSSTKASMRDIIQYAGIEEMLKSIDDDLKMLTPQQKQEFIKQELELLTEMIAENMKRNGTGASAHDSDQIMSNHSSVSITENQSPPSDPLVSRPNVFYAPYNTNRRTVEYSYNRPEYSRSADNFDAILGMQHDAVQNLKDNAENDNDLLMISWIGEGIVKDLENRRDIAVSRQKRDILESPLNKLVSDLKTKIDVPKTLDNFGAVTRHLIENSKAPMYHVRNMIGNAKNSVMAAVKTAPNNFIIPSKYEISNVDNDRKLGSINRKLLKEKIIHKAEQKKNSNHVLQENNFGIADTFQKLGSIIKESVDSGKQSVVHANDLAMDARNAVYAAKHSVPRIVSPLGQLPLLPRVASPVPKKSILLAPRIVDFSENQNFLKANAPKNNEQFLGLGNILDSVGVTRPDMNDIEVEKYLLQPGKIQVLKQWNLGHPDKLRSDWSKRDRLGMSNTVETLDDAREVLGAKDLRNMFKDVRLQMKNAIKDHLTRVTKAKKQMKKERILKKYRGIPLRKESDLSELANRQQMNNVPNFNSRTAEIGNTFEHNNLGMPLNPQKVDLHNISENNDADMPNTSTERNLVADEKITSNPMENISRPTITENDQPASQNHAENISVPYQSELEPLVDSQHSKAPPNEVDEQVQLHLPPELMKPFMGRASDNQLNTFLSEHNDIEEIKSLTTPRTSTSIVTSTTEEPIHNQRKAEHEALTHILGAIDPRMFEKLFNERFQHSTKSNAGADGQQDDDNDNNQSIQTNVDNEHNNMMDKAIESTVLPNNSSGNNDLNLNSDENSKEKIALINGNLYKKPFMGTLDKKLIKKFLKKYNHIEDSSEEDSYEAIGY